MTRCFYLNTTIVNTQGGDSAGERFTCLHVLPASEEMNIPVLEKESSGPMLPERKNTAVTLTDGLLLTIHMLEDEI